MISELNFGAMPRNKMVACGTRHAMVYQFWQCQQQQIATPEVLPIWKWGFEGQQNLNWI
jgi:hypothetical protein